MTVNEIAFFRNAELRGALLEATRNGPLLMRGPGACSWWYGCETCDRVCAIESADTITSYICRACAAAVGAQGLSEEICTCSAGEMGGEEHAYWCPSNPEDRE